MRQVAAWAADMRPRIVQMRRPKSQRGRDEREGGIRTEPTAWAPSCQRWRCELAGGWREWCGGRCEVCARHPLLLEQELNTPPLRIDVPCVRASLKTCGCAELALQGTGSTRHGSVRLECQFITPVLQGESPLSGTERGDSTCSTGVMNR